MDCKRCGGDTKILEVLDRGDRVERRRRCLDLGCSYRFVTVEVHWRESTPFGHIPKTARITPAEVKEVKLLLAQGKLSQREIGERLGLSQQQVSKIKRGVSWGYVEITGSSDCSHIGKPKS